ncbi:unnamed protein product [Diplocarpon coronariae]|uniref:U three protein 23 n=1 Tax=Diplocarpon coronariae TaxID=2795749 RepID=A0A218Z121_9HELO|nr:hypothetical protein JHW43_000313 [Diplocarpon mali]OWP01243.1 hypothetical protein B2J93_5523 [Marssonina coronariae]
MRGKRSKQYRKLMQQYGLSYGFREPYQVLLDADMIKDADRFKMDLVGGLERTLHGEVKPMITQCSMRHLYASASEPGVSYLIDKAKTYERRRCGHRPEDFPEPLSTHECLSSVVDPKGSKTNRNRYVVASQDAEVRRGMRGVLGVPLVYINRSVMIMEPMAERSTDNREREERGKFRDGLRRGGGVLKRKRDGEGGEEGEKVEGEESTKKKKKKGPKEPNPLSMPKPKKKASEEAKSKSEKEKWIDTSNSEQVNGGKRKRKRKPKAGITAGGRIDVEAEAVGEGADGDD